MNSMTHQHHLQPICSVGLGSTTTSEDGAKEEIKELRASSLGLPAAP
jgi:hypothetical protein